MSKFVVEGGIFKDTTFTEVETPSNTYIFNNYADARKMWWELTCMNVDICEHRIFIHEVDDFNWEDYKNGN